jgi:DNA-binding transcriptional MocR family regulator
MDMKAERTASGQAETAPAETHRLAIGSALVALRLDRSRDHVPLAEQIVERLAAAIRGGVIGPGVRLPSIRLLARRLGVSVHTAVEAYDRLAALGLTLSRPGAGVFVSPSANEVPAPAALPRPNPGDPLGLSMEANGAREGVPTGRGFLPAAWVQDAWQGSVLARAGRRMAAALTTSTPPAGDETLRTQIATKLLSQGIPAAPEDIVVTPGATGALDLVIRASLKPGDAVLVEDPGYFMLFQMLERHGVRMIPVPRRHDGPDLPAVEAACLAHRPRAFFVQTVLHNPTGWTAAPSNLHGLLVLAERHDLMLVEDDVCGDLHPGTPLRLASLAGRGVRVAYVGSFTKVLGPGARLGFLACDAARAGAILQLKVLSALTGSAVEEMLLSEMLAAGSYRRHLDRLRPRLASARALVTRRLAELGFDSDEPAEGGLFLWAGLPDPEMAAAVAEAARSRGIALMGGDLFRPGRAPSRHLRINASRSTDPMIFETLREVWPARMRASG